MEIQALLFDVDGTLADTEEAHRHAFNEAFVRVGLDWHWDQALYRELLKVAGGKERILSYAARYRPDDEMFVAERLRDVHGFKTESYTALVAVGAVTLRPGVARLIAEARSAGLKLGIATTTSLPNVIALLRSTLRRSPDDLFDVIAAGDMVARKKPWPDIYKLALGELGLPASSCIAFEDSRNGVLAARRAGLATVVTPSTYTSDEDFDDVLCVLSDFGEPKRPYHHIGGAGADDGFVTVASLRRWATDNVPEDMIGHAVQTV